MEGPTMIDFMFSYFYLHGSAISDFYSLDRTTFQVDFNNCRRVVATSFAEISVEEVDHAAMSELWVVYREYFLWHRHRIQLTGRRWCRFRYGRTTISCACTCGIVFNTLLVGSRQRYIGKSLVESVSTVFHNATGGRFQEEELNDGLPIGASVTLSMNAYPALIGPNADFMTQLEDQLGGHLKIHNFDLRDYGIGYMVTWVEIIHPFLNI
jgi:hypothetical protein